MNILAALRNYTIIKHVEKTWKAWSEMNMGTLSASIAYYALFSLAPLTIIIIAVTSLFWDSATITQNVVYHFGQTFGTKGMNFIQSLLQNSAEQQTNIVMTIIGFAVVILGAANIFTQLQTGLDRIFQSQPIKHKNGVWHDILRKFLSMGIVLSVGLLMLASLAMTAIVTLISKSFIDILPQTEMLVRAIEIAISLGAVSVFFALTYKYLPSKRITWKAALVAGFFSGIVFFASKTVLGILLVSDDAFSMFGGASTLALLIAWIYAMCQIFFMGAFIARVYLLPHIDD